MLRARRGLERSGRATTGRSRQGVLLSRSRREGRAPCSASSSGLTVLLLLWLLGLSACGEPCRGIETRALDFECSPLSSFTGELHFDSAAPFDTFLRQQCLDGDDAEADRILASVDFTREAVFVARGSKRVTAERCLESRGLDEAQVCATGLKVTFRDRESGPDACSAGLWTVAFVLEREDMRAALDATR